MSKGHTARVAAALLCTILALPAHSQDSYVVPAIIHTDVDSARLVDDEIGAEIGIGQFLNDSFAIEARLNSTNFNGPNDSDAGIRELGIFARWVFMRENTISPYLVGGVGVLNNKSSIIQDDTRAALSVGAGLEWQLADSRWSLRAEYRLRLRANNVTSRLTGLGIAAGCVGDERRRWYERREQQRARFAEVFDREIAAKELAETGLNVRRDTGIKKIEEWLRHDGIDLTALEPWIGDDLAGDTALAQEMAEDAAYAPYLERQEAELRDLRASEALELASDFPYSGVPGLSNEMVERLSDAAPPTLAAAGRVPGVTPAALAALLVHARRLDAESADGAVQAA